MIYFEFLKPLKSLKFFGLLSWWSGWGIHHLREGIRERTQVEPRESFGIGENEDSRPSKVVLFPYFLPSVLCCSQYVDLITHLKAFNGIF